jgi:hypothetical protein
VPAAPGPAGPAVAAATQVAEPERVERDQAAKELVPAALPARRASSAVSSPAPKSASSSVATRRPGYLARVEALRLRKRGPQAALVLSVLGGALRLLASVSARRSGRRRG